MSCGKPIRKFKNYSQEIGLLYILKDYQKMGLGKALFKKAYEEIKNAGYKEFFISCNKYNYNAQEFYKKMGGKIIHVDDDTLPPSERQVKLHYDVV